MILRRAEFFKQHHEVAKLLECILSDDILELRDLLRQNPALTNREFLLKSEIRNAADYFVEELAHYIYSGDTALHIASMAYCVDAVELLLENGADVNGRNRRGAVPLHYACDGGPGSPTWAPSRQAMTIEKLIEAGTDPNILDKSGVAPLHRAVRQRCTGAVRALIACGANVNLKNESGSTPMLLAELTTGRGGSGSAEAKKEKAKIIELLAEAGGR